jgi:hypothetical protein
MARQLQPPLKSMNGYHRLRYSRRSKTASVGASGRNEPLPFRSERPVNRFLDCGHRLRFDCRLAHDHHAINRRRPGRRRCLNAIGDVPSKPPLEMCLVFILCHFAGLPLPETASGRARSVGRGRAPSLPSRFARGRRRCPRPRHWR